MSFWMTPQADEESLGRDIVPHPECFILHELRHDNTKTVFARNNDFVVMTRQSLPLD
ncbi:MAG: hypothetical protein PHF74_01440 [Dehalococcoidales bacterium]|nr:hypothetical protein [Dehalococcoidales bacterium]